jgi:hypothetical protein
MIPADRGMCIKREYRNVCIRSGTYIHIKTKVLSQFSEAKIFPHSIQKINHTPYKQNANINAIKLLYLQHNLCSLINF